MDINFSDKDIKALGYLRRCLNAKVVPVEKLETFLDAVEQKLKNSAPPKSRQLKVDRQDRYRMKVIK